MMFSSNKFFRGLLGGALSLGAIFFAAHVLLTRVGEIGLNSVIDRQLSGADYVLYLSGLNQDSFVYKQRLVNRVRPEVIAIGSSRAMQIRQEFFSSRFVNMGGAVNSIGDLEAVADDFLKTKVEDRPNSVLLFVDPWWFNRQFAGDGGSNKSHSPPADLISASLFSGAARLLRKGNWISASVNSKNLGIQAILTGDGFSKDGSYHYNGLVSGRESGTLALTDIRFSDTLTRIAESRSRFEKAEHADKRLIMRACAAVSKVRSVATVLLIAPPFSSVVWKKMSEGGYAYIEEVHSSLAHCLEGAEIFDFSSPEQIHGSSDCEFVDGFHGGDVTYARMLKEIATKTKVANLHVSRTFIEEFIKNNAGYAAGIARQRFPDLKEVDFLHLGCKK